MSNKKINLKDFNLKELQDFFGSIGEKPFRAKQVFEWMYKGVDDFSQMTNLSKDLRKKLEESSTIMSLVTADIQMSKDESTAKFLFQTDDDELIESVLMKYRYGNSICISSQAGCKMGCSFCASGLNGLNRSLSSGEMVDQLLLAQNIMSEEIRNLVIMGIGEPFDNYDNVKKAVENLSSEDGLGISRRSITVSTCGLIPVIKKFQRDLPQVNLAVSLHAPNDEIRTRIMPINKKYPISELIKASKEYIQETGRRITFEYALIKGVNDKVNNAEELIRLLRGINCHVNLIPLNDVDETGYISSNRHAAEIFRDILEEKNIQVTIRREMGKDIDAACGQLRLKNHE